MGLSPWRGLEAHCPPGSLMRLRREAYEPSRQFRSEHKVKPGTAIEALLPLLSSDATHEAMVVDANRVLVGVITQTDLLAVLYRAHVVEAVVASKVA